VPLLLGAVSGVADMCQGVCTERVIAMCVLCPVQASLN
jgi:hypothetical protein